MTLPKMNAPPALSGADSKEKGFFGFCDPQDQERQACPVTSHIFKFRIGSLQMYTGTLTKMDADNAFAGDIASLDFDINFSMVANDFKAKDQHPDPCTRLT